MAASDRLDPALVLVRPDVTDIDHATKAAAPVFPETLRGRPATTGGLLEFQCAQQALAYLHLTLTPLQLKHLFPTSAADFMAVLDAASRCDDEAEALRGLRGMEVIFRAPAWGQAAQPDQALAGRYVLGRIAMLRIYKTAAESAGKVV